MPLKKIPVIIKKGRKGGKEREEKKKHLEINLPINIPNQSCLKFY